MENNRKNKNLQLLLTSRITVVLGSILVILLFVMYFLLLKNTSTKEIEYNEYEYRIAIIADETDNSFWADVYAGAKDTGEEYNALVEQIGDGVLDGFSIEDAINIAIYTDVDGILLRPTEGEFNEEMIDKAISHGIPVITMQKDLPNSQRQGFVGINDYFLGQKYGKRVLKLMSGKSGLVTVLFPAASFDETSQNWFRLGLINTVQEEGICFDFKTIQDDKGLNNAEDVIHDILASEGAIPNIVLCLDETITQSTSQLIRDSELSDKVKVIGSYVSDSVFDKIEDGYLESVITVDPYAMGKSGIDALMMYKKYNIVSYYTEVDTMLLDKEAIAKYRLKEEDDAVSKEEN